VIQNDLGNRNTSITIVAAITSKPSRTPFSIEVKVEPAKGNGLVLSSAILLTQIRTVDRERLVRRLGRLDASTMTKVDEALKVSLGLVDL
jgi:mRNA interferase MazF